MGRAQSQKVCACYSLSSSQLLTSFTAVSGGTGLCQESGLLATVRTLQELVAQNWAMFIETQKLFFNEKKTSSRILTRMFYMKTSHEFLLSLIQVQFNI